MSLGKEAKRPSILARGISINCRETTAEGRGERETGLGSVWGSLSPSLLHEAGLGLGLLIYLCQFLCKLRLQERPGCGIVGGGKEGRELRGQREAHYFKMRRNLTIFFSFETVRFET